MTKITLGLDIGNGDTKLVGDMGKRFIIPSTISQGEVFNNNSLLCLTIDGKEVTIGKDDGEVNMSHDKFVSDPEFHDTLLFGSIAGAYRDVKGDIEVNLMSGAPIRYYKALKDSYKTALLNKGIHEVVYPDGTKKKISIINADVSPQSAAIFTDSKKYRPLQVLVIDIGAGTTDTSWWKNNKHVNHDSTDDACMKLYLNVAGTINGNEVTDFTDIQIKDAIRNGSYTVTNHLTGKDINFRDILDAEVKKMTNILVTRIRKIYSLGSAQVIILTGGGANIFGEAFREIFPNIIIEGNQYVNAEVYYELGKVKFDESV